MNTRYTTVNLDVSQQGSIPSITLSQYDLGVGLGFYIMDGGLPYSEFAETDTVVLSGTKPSGVGFTVPAYYKSGNLCSFRTTQAMTTEAGTVTCEITITKVNNISVSTANFFVEVEASAHAHETVDEDIEDFSLIANQVGEYKAVAVRAAQQAAQSATDAAASAGSAEESMEAAQSAASSAIAAKDDIQEYIDDSEAWARGTRGGEAVPSTDETYENNAKYYAEQSSQASIDAGVSATEAAASAQEASASVVGAVKYTAQSLTTEQKAQARTNIGAASPSDIPSGTVRYDTSQSLTDAQKTQAKNNIGVPAVDATLAVTGAAADAKKVGDEIEDLKGDLDAQTGIIRMTKNAYIDTSTTPISLEPHYSSAGRMYAVIDCVPNDKFVINAYSNSSVARAWCFIDSANNAISMAEALVDVMDLELTAPNNAVKLIINDMSGGMSYKVGNNLATKTSNGLSDDIISALLDCFAHVAWANEYGQDYYETLEHALYEQYITAVFNPGAHTVYADDKLDSLKQYLVVTWFKKGESSGTVVSPSNYSLSGSLNTGTNTITVSYNGLTTTFSVTATEFSQRIVFVDRAQFTNHSNVTPEIFLEFPNTYYQSFAAANSPLPKFKFGPAGTSSGTLTQESLYSAIKVPSGKTKVKVTCSSAYKCNIICYNLNLDESYYRNIAYTSGWQSENTSFVFDVSNYQYFVVGIFSSDTTASNYSISFE